MPHREASDVVKETPFYISATGATHRPRKTLKHDDMFLVVDDHGDIGVVGGGPDGLFDSDTRYVSRLELLINGMEPLHLGSSIRSDNLFLSVDLTNPDIYRDGELILPKDQIHISRILFIYDSIFWQRIGIENHSMGPVNFALSIAFASDFADIFEIRGQRRQKRGHATSLITSASEVATRYLGRDRVARTLDVTFEPKPHALQPTMATYQFDLAHGAKTVAVLSMACRRNGTASTFFGAMRSGRRERERGIVSGAVVETANTALNEVLYRSRADLAMLLTKTMQGPFPYAGIPWFSTTFGRDAMIAAMQVLWLDPSIAKSVLLRLAALQATDVDAASDAQPGKIVHELRGGEMAMLGEVPFRRYYGSVDSTPLFLMLLGLYVDRTGDLALAEELRPAAEMALKWITTYGDVDGDGFVEYARQNEDGLVNQGWKDSSDSVFHADGRLAKGPIALVEVQAYVYSALRHAARTFDRLHSAERAAHMVEEAEAFRAAFERAFWSEKLGSYVLALDGNKSPCLVSSSNAGHALFAGISSPEHAARVARGFASAEMDCGWGIRTVSSKSARYNPMSYHNGSVWPHDTAIVASGLCRYGYKAQAARLFDRLYQSATFMEYRRLPELFCGFSRRLGRGPTLYPVACAPQAWSCGALSMILQSLLGLEVDVDRSEVRLRDPCVPDCAGEITVKGLRVGDASIDFAVAGAGGATSLRVLRTSGRLSASIVSGTKDGDGRICA